MVLRVETWTAIITHAESRLRPRSGRLASVQAAFLTGEEKLLLRLPGVWQFCVNKPGLSPTPKYQQNFP